MLFVVSQGKLLHCKPPPGVDCVVFNPRLANQKDTLARSKKPSAVSVFCNCVFFAVVMTASQTNSTSSSIY